MSGKRRQDVLSPPGPQADLESRRPGPRHEQAVVATTTGRLYSRFNRVRHDEAALLGVLQAVPRIDRHHARIALFQALGGPYGNAGARALELCERVFGAGTVFFPGERPARESQGPRPSERPVRDAGPSRPPPWPLERVTLAHRGGGSRLGGSPLFGSWNRSATREAKAHRQATAEARLNEDPPALEVLGQGGGEPLPEAVQVRMSRLFGHDFTHVRIHTDDAAAEAAALLGARALALGTHIYFGAHQYAPGTPAGERLLIHELVHVVQLDEGRLPAGGGGDARVSQPEDAAEREAEAMSETLSRQAAALNVPVSPSVSLAEASQRGPAVARVGADVDGRGQGARTGSSRASAPAAAGAHVLRTPGEAPSWLERLGAVGEWVWVVAQGDFAEDPSTGQIVVRTLLTLIPGVDQVADVEDVTAALYKLVWLGRYDEPGPWVDLVLSAIGIIPEFGSLAKGVLKIVGKGRHADQVASLLRHLGVSMADVGRRVVPQLEGLARHLPEYLQQARHQLEPMLDRVIRFLGEAQRYGRRLDGELAVRIGRWQAGIRQVRRSLEQKVEEVTEFLRRELDDLIERLRRRDGDAATHGAGADASPPGHGRGEPVRRSPDGDPDAPDGDAIGAGSAQSSAPHEGPATQGSGQPSHAGGPDHDPPHEGRPRDPAPVAATYHVGWTGPQARRHLKKHAQHARETARRLGLPRPETLDDVMQFLERVVREGEQRIGPWYPLGDVRLSRLGDSIVMRRMNGDYVSNFDSRLGGNIVQRWNGARHTR